MSTLRLISPNEECFEVKGDAARIGRDPACEIHLPDSSVSRSHSLIQRLADGSWMISDQNSANGTIVDGRTIERAPLQHGQSVQVGLLSFTVQIDTGEQGPTLFLDRAMLERKAAQRAGTAPQPASAADQTVLAPRQAETHNNFLWWAVGGSSGAALALGLFMVGSYFTRPASEPASSRVNAVAQGASAPPTTVASAPEPTLPSQRSDSDRGSARAPGAPSATTARASLLVVADEACDFRVDDARVARLQAGGLKRVSVALGEHYLQATTPDGRRWEQVIATRQPEQVVIRIHLPPGPPRSEPSLETRTASAAPPSAPALPFAPPPPAPAATQPPALPPAAAPQSTQPAQPQLPPATTASSTPPTPASRIPDSSNANPTGPDERRIPEPARPAPANAAPPAAQPAPTLPPPPPAAAPASARPAPAALGQFGALAAPGGLGSGARKAPAGTGTLVVRSSGGGTLIINDARRVPLKGGEESIALDAGMHVVVFETADGKAQWQRLVSIGNGQREVIAAEAGRNTAPATAGGAALDLTAWEGAWTLDQAAKATVNGCPVAAQHNWYVYVSRDLRDTTRLAPAELSLVYTHNLDRAALGVGDLARCQQAAGDTAAYQARYTVRINAGASTLEGQFTNCELADCRLAPTGALSGSARLEGGRLTLALGGGRTLTLTRAK